MSESSPVGQATPPTPPTGGAEGTGAADPASAARPRVSTRRLVVVGVLVSLFLAGVVSFYASSHPDGLVFVAGEKGFLSSAGPHVTDGSPFAGYSTRGVGDARLSGGIAGVVGATLVFLLAGGLFLAVRRRDRSATVSGTSGAATGAATRDASRDGDG